MMQINYSIKKHGIEVNLIKHMQNLYPEICEAFLRKIKDDLKSRDYAIFIDYKTQDTHFYCNIIIYSEMY